MSRTLTAADRSALIRLASTMEKGSEERRTVLAAASSFYFPEATSFDEQVKMWEAQKQKGIKELKALLKREASRIGWSVAKVDGSEAYPYVEFDLGLPSQDPKGDLKLGRKTITKVLKKQRMFASDRQRPYFGRNNQRLFIPIVYSPFSLPIFT